MPPRQPFALFRRRDDAEGRQPRSAPQALSNNRQDAKVAKTRGMRGDLGVLAVNLSGA